MSEFRNPFTPGAGHQPPYLAGRESERKEFLRLLEQDTIFDNMLLTGLRGVGKTVLFDTLGPLTAEKNWCWVGTDLSEAASINEETLVTRVFTDLAAVTSDIVIDTVDVRRIGFSQESSQTESITLQSPYLKAIYDNTPGLASDKLKETLKYVWTVLSKQGYRGVVFAYDEAQNLSDNTADRDQYPLSMMLDVFQSLQRAELPLMLALSGLPTLFPKLVEARTYTERMFRVVSLESLNKDETRQAVLKPIESDKCPVKLDDKSVDIIYEKSGGYPYFIQFICREVYNAFIQRHGDNTPLSVPVKEIQNKLDNDFFSGRWQRATDRQRDLLTAVAHTMESEFSIQQIVESSRQCLEKPFSNSSQVSQILAALTEQGLVFKNRHGRYSLAVPMFDEFIRRQSRPSEGER